MAGCARSPEDKPQSAAPESQASPTADTAAMNVPLTPDQVGARYRISREAVLTNGGQAIRTIVAVTNTGKVAINSHGSKPINLAISLVDDSGKVVAQDFVRSALPADGIAAGHTADVTTEVPVQPVLGKRLRFGLVQESVAWYSDFKVEPLDYGPLSACESASAGPVCKDGQPLKSEAQQ